jgi:hypothetical protein
LKFKIISKCSIWQKEIFVGKQRFVGIGKQRSFLKIHYLLGAPKYQVESWLKNALGDNAMKRTIDEWYNMFESGQTKTEN